MSRYADSPRWRRLSRRFRVEHPVCATDGCHNKSQVVHHLDGQGLDGPRAYDPSNLQALCTACHNKITGRLQAPFAVHSKARARRPEQRHPGLTS